MDTTQWAQEIGMMKPMTDPRGVAERKVRPQNEQALNCPRCHSTNTKFCYYNNYSLTQPRYFCKTCRRYWTEGGSLRNVPVGGGSRKNKLIRSSSSSHTLPDLNPPTLSHFSSPQSSKNQDLNLALPAAQQQYHHGVQEFLEIPQNIEINKNNNTHLNLNSSSSSSSTLTSLSALELLKTGIASRGLNSFPTPMTPVDSSLMYLASEFPFQEFKPPVGFSVERFHGNQENGAAGRLNFPFEALAKQQLPNTKDVDQDHKGQGNPAVYWNGMLGGRSW